MKGSRPDRPFAKRGLYERFQRVAAALGWTRRMRKPLLVAVSGGRDSVVLLHLCRVCDFPVIAAHLNHRLRGRESDRDEAFVRRLCRNWNVPVVTGRENVPQRVQRHRLSPEEAARIARYRFLGDVATRRKIRNIVVAHHQRDQVETILLKIFRGCKRKDLRGMPLKRALPRFSWNPIPRQAARTTCFLVRPLLEAPDEEIALYARQNRLAFRSDSSNRDLSYPRNWIRHKLLPLLKRRLQRNIEKTIVKLGED